MSAAVERVAGVVSADLNFASATLVVSYDPAVDPLPEVVRAVEATGHGLERLDAVGGPEVVSELPWFERHLTELATAGSGAGTLLGFVLGLGRAPEWASIAAFAIAICAGGLLIWRRALLSLRVRVLDMNVLMSLAVLGAAALGEWSEGATVFFLFALGGLLESRSLERTRRSIRELMDLAPSVARVRRAGTLVSVPAENVVAGETFVVRPGERIPLDGVVAHGASAIDESAVTGESVPVDKGPGERVFAGTLNTSGLLEVTAVAAAKDSTLARIVFLVEEAQASRAPSQRFVDRFSRIYTPAVIGLAVLVATLPPLIGSVTGADGAPFSEWFRRALVLLVVSCPCALVISTPVSIVSAISRASRDGVLVKGGAFIEAAARVAAVAFDKTGTLSEGRPRLARVAGFAGMDAERVLALAAAVEAHSNHPLARAIVQAAGEKMPQTPVTGFAEVPGRGVRATVDGLSVEVCSPRCARETASMGPEAERAIEEFEAAGLTVLSVIADGSVVGLVGLEDTIRADAIEALGRLRQIGIGHLVMLTGDNERVARAVAQHAGLTEYRARLLPEHKAEAVAELRRRFGIVAMVGDGVNDAPALAAADIGIAMGAAGSDVALETADVALMRDDLSALAGFFLLGRRTMRAIVGNVAFSLATKAVFLALALTGRATLWMAVFADTGVSLLVILNGMRLLRRPRKELVRHAPKR